MARGPATAGLPFKRVLRMSKMWLIFLKYGKSWIKNQPSGRCLIDDQAKILTVSEYIDRFQKEGVKINAPPALCADDRSNRRSKIRRCFSGLLGN